MALVITHLLICLAGFFFLSKSFAHTFPEGEGGGGGKGYRVEKFGPNSDSSIRNMMFCVIFLFQQTDLEWKIVFIISGVIYLLGAIFYTVFSSGEKQSWSSDRKYSNLSQHDSDCEWIDTGIICIICIILICLLFNGLFINIFIDFTTFVILN